MASRELSKDMLSEDFCLCGWDMRHPRLWRWRAGDGKEALKMVVQGKRESLADPKERTLGTLPGPIFLWTVESTLIP